MLVEPASGTTARRRSLGKTALLFLAAFLAMGAAPDNAPAPSKVDILEYPDLADATRMQASAQQGEIGRAHV